MTDDITGPLYAGTSLTALDPNTTETCQHHRLHLPFLPCHDHAEYRFTKADGEATALCGYHARALHARYVGLDSGWGTRLDNGLDIGQPNVPDGDSTAQLPMFVSTNDEAPVALPSVETFQQDAFTGGESGGGGGGADFAPAETSQAGASDVLDCGVADSASADSDASTDSTPEDGSASESTPAADSTGDSSDS